MHIHIFQIDVYLTRIESFQNWIKWLYGRVLIKFQTAVKKITKYINTVPGPMQVSNANPTGRKKIQSLKPVPDSGVCMTRCRNLIMYESGMQKKYSRPDTSYVCSGRI